MVSRWPQLLSLLLLAYQLYLPWSVKHLATQDGPAHVYTAFVAKELALHGHVSAYDSIYRLHNALLPNWTCTLLLAGIMTVVSPERAEAVLMTVCLLAGYCSFVYGVRALAPRGTHWMPIGNWILQSIFLWSGFYNFYLGMALLPLVVGFYVRHSETFTMRRAIYFSLAMVALFFSHLVAAVIAAMVILTLASWTREWRGAAAIAPTLVLVALYAGGSAEPMKFKPEMAAALRTFPQVAFAFATGRRGEQTMLWPVVLFLILVAVVGMRKREWRSARGGIAIATGLAFALYLVVPDEGFGGSVAKLRFAWAVFVLGGMLVASVDGLRSLRPVLAIYIAVILGGQLAVVQAAERQQSDAVEAYLNTASKMEPGARFVRFYYRSLNPGPERLLFLPMFHVDALAAVCLHAMDVSSYQATMGTFGVDFQPAIDRAERLALHGLEDPGTAGAKQLGWLRASLPVKIGYVVVVAEEGGEQAGMLAELNRSAQLVAENTGPVSVRVYKLGTM